MFVGADGIDAHPCVVRAESADVEDVKPARGNRRQRRDAIQRA